MTAQLSPTRIYKSWRNDGTPNANGTMWTYVAGTTTPIATYVDSTQTTQNTNPIVFNARGEANVWIDGTLLYKYVEYDSNGTLIGTTDNINLFTVTQQTIGQILWPQTAAEIAAGVVPTNYAYEPGDVRRYGAIGNGVHDDGAAISIALSCNDAVTMPTGLFYTSTTIAIPSGSGLFGAGIVNPSSVNPTSYGTVIQGSLALSVVVQLGSGLGAGASIKGMGITRKAGTPPSSSIGLKVFAGFCPIYEDIFSWSHQVCVYHKGSGTSALGFMATRLFTGAAYDAHIVIDTVPENRFEQCRIGSNGTLDQTCSAYVRVTGGNGALPAAGPNTIVFNNCQFNQGNGVHPTNWLQFANLNAPGVPTIDARVWMFSDCHIEGLDGAAIKIDSTWAACDRLGIVNCNFNIPSVAFFDLPSTAFTINGWRFAGNWIACSTFAPNVQYMNSMAISGNDFETAAITYNAAAGGGWNLSSVGNSYAAGITVTVSGTAWQTGLFADVYRPGTTFTNTGTPNSVLTVMNPSSSVVSWTPVLSFGGASVGITYNANTKAELSVMGNCITYTWRIQLTNKGVSIGNASVSGFPITHGSSTSAGGNVSLCVGNNNMAGLAAPILAIGPRGGGAGTIDLQSQGAAGTAPLTDANFTNTSDFGGVITFFA